MPNRKEHAKIGAWTGAITATLLNLAAQAQRKQLDPNYQINWLESAVVGTAGYFAGRVGGQLPDIFEPAYHPGHRNFFHSGAFGTLAMTMAKKINDNPTVSDGVKLVLNASTLAYVSHLAMDGDTPAGVPVLFKY